MDWLGRSSWDLLDIVGDRRQMQRERASGDGKEHKLLPVYPNGGPFTGERAKVAGNAAFLERFLLFPARPGSFGA
jgi:hypothetical protein